MRGQTNERGEGRHRARLSAAEGHCVLVLAESPPKAPETLASCCGAAALNPSDYVLRPRSGSGCRSPRAATSLAVLGLCSTVAAVKKTSQRARRRPSSRQINADAPQLARHGCLVDEGVVELHRRGRLLPALGHRALAMAIQRVRSCRGSVTGARWAAPGRRHRPRARRRAAARAGRHRDRARGR